MYFVYIIETEDGTYYTGQTNDLARRFKEHLSGTGGATYLRMHRPEYLVHLEEYDSRGDAMKREAQIKKDAELKMALIDFRRDIREVIATEESYR